MPLHGIETRSQPGYIQYMGDIIDEMHSEHLPERIAKVELPTIQRIFGL